MSKGHQAIPRPPAKRAAAMALVNGGEPYQLRLGFFECCSYFGGKSETLEICEMSSLSFHLPRDSHKTEQHRFIHMEGSVGPEISPKYGYRDSGFGS